jgi:hypothetical protein
MIQGDPKFMRRVNGCLAIFWLLMIPLSLVMGWLESVTFVSALSLWALVSGHWSAWQASRTEVEQQKEETKAPKRIAKEIVKETDVKAGKNYRKRQGQPRKK